MAGHVASAAHGPRRWLAGDVAAAQHRRLDTVAHRRGTRQLKRVGCTQRDVGLTDLSVVGVRIAAVREEDLASRAKLVSTRVPKRADRRARSRQVVRVPVSCCVCGQQRYVRPGLVRGFTYLVCASCNGAGKHPAVTERQGMVLCVEYNVAGVFVGYTHRIATVAERESIDRAIALARYAGTVQPLRPTAVRYVADTRDQIWITNALLKSRGWTEAAIRDFLPRPEGHKRNPHYASAVPMPVWTPQTVAAAESSRVWKDWLAKSLKRRGLSVPSAAVDGRFADKAARAAAAIAACQDQPATMG